MHTGYVVTKSGTVLVQVPADNQWGFSLHSDDQEWPGGVGWQEWEAVADEDPRVSVEDRERLDWMLEEG